MEWKETIKWDTYMYICISLEQAFSNPSMEPLEIFF